MFCAGCFAMKAGGKFSGIGRSDCELKEVLASPEIRMNYITCSAETYKSPFESVRWLGVSSEQSYPQPDSCVAIVQGVCVCL